MLQRVLFLDGVTSADLTLRPNRSGVYAIFNAPGFADLTTWFAPTVADWRDQQTFDIFSDSSLRHGRR